MKNDPRGRFVAALGVTACLVLLPGDVPTAQSAQGIGPQAMAQIQSLLREKAARTRTQKKISSQLIYAQRMARRESIAQGVNTLFVDVPTAADGRVVVDVRASVTASLIQRLQNAGVTILSSEPGLNALRLQAGLDQIEEIAGQPEISFVLPMQQAVTNRHEVPHTRPNREALKAAVRRAMQEQAITQVGNKQSEGDTTHAANTARTTYGIDGTGVKIGVLSDAVQSLAASQASGDLGAVTIVPGQSGSGLCGTSTCDEGTAMLEIIHDLAPGAQLFFATAFNGTASFANNIRTLRNTYGCDIIVDDVFYFAESPFQDGQASNVISPNNAGVVAQAVKDVTAAGALYFSSAGNSGNANDSTSGAWEGDFLNGGNITISGYGTRPIHNFRTAGSPQNFNVITSNGFRIVSLYWADPLGGSSNDYDLFILSSDGSSILSSSTGTQDGTQDPYESASFSSSVSNPRIVVVKWAGSDRFLHISTNRGRLSIATAGEIHGHSATSATNSFAVAATPAAAGQGSTGPYPGVFNTGNKVETFSSDGPRRIFFNADGSAITAGNFSSTGGQLLNKPDLTAADGVSVTGAGGFSSPFYGTSAAAPHAAAIAALIKSASLSLTAAQVRTALLDSALDIESSGTDRDSGVGIVMAGSAVQSVLSPVMVLDTPTSGASPTQPFVASGFAIDRRATSGTGVSAVHVYAIPSGGSAQLIGAATYGTSRSDIGTTYGSRFAPSGFTINVNGLSPGTYTLVAYAFSTFTSSFSQSQSAVISIASASTLPAMSLDGPANGSTINPSFTASGWAIDRASTSNSGVDAVHVYAFTRSGTSLGSGTFLGVATLGVSRLDVGAAFGPQFNNAGYTLAVSGLAPGTYRLVAYARSSLAGAFNQSQFSDITVGALTSNPAMALDAPAAGTRAQPFQVVGWAIDRAASSGPGVDAVHVWAFPTSGGGAQMVGVATLGGSRGDVGALFGSQFTNSGYTLTVTGLTSGQQYALVVFARSTVTGTFNQTQSVTVTIQ